MTRVTEVSSYLHAVSIGIRQSTAAELPVRLVEIVRNLEVLLEEAKRDLTRVPEITDTHL